VTVLVFQQGIQQSLPSRTPPLPKKITLVLLLLSYALAGLIWAATAAGQVQTVDQAQTVRLQPCKVQEVPTQARCGTFSVYEDRGARSGRTIALHIVVIPAMRATFATEPVFWLEGGPGGAATKAAGPVSQNYLRSLRNDHDLVFVDERGTGKSNPLKCDDIGENPGNLDGYFGKLFPPQMIRACREKLEKTADLKLYTTAIAMDDLDEVRAALGYPRINLAGASYGTLAAQVFIRKYPEHVRSAFLVGIVTPGFMLPLPFAQAAQNALDLLLKDCSADLECHTRFPNLKDEFYGVLSRFDQGALKVKLTDPAIKRERFVTLERESYVEHLRALLYSTYGAGLIPYVVHQAYRNNFIPFGVVAERFNLGGPATSRGLYFSVTCAEAIPFITEQEIVVETRGTFLGDRRVRAHVTACAEWPKGEIPKGFTDPVKSEIPIVMFSGEADGSTPPWIAEAAVKLWPNGRQIIAPHTGHQIDGPCTWDLMQTFFKAASATGLDVSCVEKAKRPRFATNLSDLE
jgi:pimeloyl-ACP methyl ester carboxylesterase